MPLQFLSFLYLMTICKCCMKLRYIFRQQQYKAQNMRESVYVCEREREREREIDREREGVQRKEDNNEK